MVTHPYYFSIIIFSFFRFALANRMFPFVAIEMMDSY